jgi:hypothetical protein
MEELEIILEIIVGWDFSWIKISFRLLRIVVAILKNKIRKRKQKAKRYKYLKRYKKMIKLNNPNINFWKSIF